MVYDAKYNLVYKLISDIISQQEILLSINCGGGSIAEARIEKGLPFRIKDKWATIISSDRQIRVLLAVWKAYLHFLINAVRHNAQYNFIFFLPL